MSADIEKATTCTHCPLVAVCYGRVPKNRGPNILKKKRDFSDDRCEPRPPLTPALAFEADRSHRSILCAGLLDMLPGVLSPMCAWFGLSFLTFAGRSSYKTMKRSCCCRTQADSGMRARSLLQSLTYSSGKATKGGVSSVQRRS